MFTYTQKQLPKHTKEFLVEIAWDTILTKREEAFNEMAKHVIAPGFREGKAPRDIAARHIRPQKVYEKVVRDLLPDIYKEIVEKEKLRPVTSPSVELTEAKDDTAWKLTIQIPEIPEVQLKDYKKKISEVHAKASEAKRDTPKGGEADLKTGGKKQTKDKKSQEKQTETRCRTAG
jgi:trigger factor